MALQCNAISHWLGTYSEWFPGCKAMVDHTAVCEFGENDQTATGPKHVYKRKNIFWSVARCFWRRLWYNVMCSIKGVMCEWSVANRMLDNKGVYLTLVSWPSRLRSQQEIAVQNRQGQLAVKQIHNIYIYIHIYSFIEVVADLSTFVNKIQVHKI